MAIKQLAAKRPSNRRRKSHPPTKHPVYGWGFDLEKPVRHPVTTLAAPAAPLPKSARVDPQLIPPAGNQGKTPSCWAWSSTYGAATVEAAAKGGFSASDPANQASSTYTYVKTMMAAKTASGTCSDGHPCDCFEFLKANGGTPTIAAAPAATDCPTAWSEYGASSLSPDARFEVQAWKTVSITGEEGMTNLRTVLAQGKPLVYCTSTYTDFEGYRGTPSPYVGNGVIDTDGSGKAIGHCMMIAGYDDEMGAVLVLNSWSPFWGETVDGAGGYAWITYETFQKLAQGTASFIIPNAA